MSILEKEGCSLADTKAKNQIKRFELRDKLEKHYFFKDLEQDMKNKFILENRYSYKRYNNIEDRGFDIITLDPLMKPQKENKKLRHNKNDWDKICENSRGELKVNLTTNNDREIQGTKNAFNNTHTHINKGLNLKNNFLKIKYDIYLIIKYKIIFKIKKKFRKFKKLLFNFV